MENKQFPQVVRLSAPKKQHAAPVVLAARMSPTPRVLSTPRTEDSVREKSVPVVHSFSHHKKAVSRISQRQAHQLLSASLGMTLATGVLGKAAAVLLIPMLLLQPILPVYAADEVVTGEVAPSPSSVEAPAASPAPESPPAPVDEAPSSDTTTTETSSEEATPETPAETPASDTPQPLDETPAPSEEAPENIEDKGQSEDTQGGVVDGAATTTSDTVQASGAPEETSTTTDTTSSDEISVSNVAGGGGGAANETENNEGATAHDEAMVTPTETGETDTTPPDETNTEAEVTAEEVSVVDDATIRAAQVEAARQAEEARQEQIRQTIKKEVESEFTKGCLTLDGVGYYCLKNFDGSAVGALTPSIAVTGVESHKDPDGNYKQIFITRGGESIQLTHDAWDNTFPSMDVSGKSVVWQGMAQGRWQIFIADVSSTGTPVITQLTHGTESNFNPRVDGDSIVWQGWVNGNWEIFLAERLLPAAYYPLRPDTPQDPGGGLPAENRMLGIDNTWHVTRLTTNDTHDMFPAIAGGLVTWQSSQGGSWNVYAYSMKSGVTTKLSQDGTKNENPRFAVTWDEHDANGNARMVGYDIASGKTIDITNEARNTPSGSAPYRPTETPISQPNQAALPPTGVSGTSTPVRGDGDDGGGANPLGS